MMCEQQQNCLMTHVSERILVDQWHMIIITSGPGGTGRLN